MSEKKIQSILRAAEIIRAQDEKETELDRLVAVSMQTGYELGRQTAGENPCVRECNRPQTA